MALDIIDLLEILDNPAHSKKIPDSLKVAFGDNWEKFIEIVISILNVKKVRMMTISRSSSYSSSSCDTPLSLSPSQGGLVVVSSLAHSKSLSPVRSAFKPCKSIEQIFNDIEEEIFAKLPPLQAVEAKNITWQSLYTHFIKNILPAIDLFWQRFLDEMHRQEALELERQEQERAELSYEKCQESFSEKIELLKRSKEQQSKKPFLIGSINEAVLIKCKIHPSLLQDAILEDLLRMKFCFVYIDLPKYRGIYKLQEAGTKLIQLNISKENLDKQNITTFSENDCLLEKLQFNEIYLLNGTSRTLFLELPEVPKKMSPVVSKKSPSRLMESSWAYLFSLKPATRSPEIPRNQVPAVPQSLACPVKPK